MLKNLRFRVPVHFLVARTAFVGAVFAGVCAVHAQPAIISVVPARGATGISATAPVVFTFSAAMNPGTTSVSFYSGTGVYPTVTNWNLGDTVLTCTPSPAFPGNTTITWLVFDFTSAFYDMDTFTTGGSSVNGTNASTTFMVGKVYYYDQNSTALPTLDTNVSYAFFGGANLISNRLAGSVMLTPPGGSGSSLSQGFPGNWSTHAFFTDLTASETAYPPGSYQFFVTEPTSNQTVTVTLQATTAQPPAPHISNYAAAQSVNASNAFTLTWDTWSGGTAADYIGVTVGNFNTPILGNAGALPGTATSVQIPANTLQAGSNYDAAVIFYRYTAVSNSTYATLAYRATETVLTLTTVSTSLPHPVLTNAVWSGNTLTFDVISAAGQPVTVLSSTNMSAGSWVAFQTTNVPPAGRVHIVPPVSTQSYLFYRARTGN